MSDAEFWTLIATIDQEALEAGDEDGALQPLIQALVAKNERELQDFGEILSQRLYALDGEEFAKHAGQSGKSGDGFLYARCYVVAKGKENYESVLADPRIMPKSIDQWCESLLYVNQKAWAESTGNSAEDWGFLSSVSYETGSNAKRWPNR